MPHDRWAEWDADRKAGRLPSEMAGALSDETLADLLASTGTGRPDERAILAVEALKRVTDARQARNLAAGPPDPEAERHRETVNRAAARIHQAGRPLEKATTNPSDARLKAAREASLSAEQHRAAVETGIELHAKLHKTLQGLHKKHHDKDAPPPAKDSPMD